MSHITPSGPRRDRCGVGGIEVLIWGFPGVVGKQTAVCFVLCCAMAPTSHNSAEHVRVCCCLLVVAAMHLIMHGAVIG